MKKIIIASTIFILLISGSTEFNNFSLLDFFEGEYCVYTSEYVSGATNLGFCYMSNKKINKLRLYQN